MQRYSMTVTYKSEGFLITGLAFSWQKITIKFKGCKHKGRTQRKVREIPDNDPVPDKPISIPENLTTLLFIQVLVLVRRVLQLYSVTLTDIEDELWGYLTLCLKETVEEKNPRFYLHPQHSRDKGKQSLAVLCHFLIVSILKKGISFLELINLSPFHFYFFFFLILAINEPRKHETLPWTAVYKGRQRQHSWGWANQKVSHYIPASVQ